MNTHITQIQTPGREGKALIRILAIDPGTKCLGIAVFVGGDLLRWDVENLRETSMSPRQIRAKAETILGRWIQQYRPDVLALELPHFAQSRKSRSLGRLVSTITTLAARQGLGVKSYLPTTVRKRVCPAGRPTRHAVARAMAERYPWLDVEYRTEAARSWWENPYWLTMFDAVALGLVCYEDYLRRHSRRNAA
jgi:Holliday junction resolvasome RuvABC endonuclease subunit